MGLIGQIIEVVRAVRNGASITEIRIDVGGGRIRTTEHFGPPGDDSHPLTTDYPITIKAPGTGRTAIVGYIDTVNADQSEPGERRFYARDAEGAPIGYVWLKNDGTVGLNGLTNHAVQYEALLEAFNQLRADLNALKDLHNDHKHLYIPGAGSPTDTAVTTSLGSDSTADMTGSKVDSVRVP